jgi:hypothetical protein
VAEIPTVIESRSGVDLKPVMASIPAISAPRRVRTTRAVLGRFGHRHRALGQGWGPSEKSPPPGRGGSSRSPRPAVRSVGEPAVVGGPLRSARAEATAETACVRPSRSAFGAPALGRRQRRNPRLGMSLRWQVTKRRPEWADTPRSPPGRPSR